MKNVIGIIITSLLLTAGSALAQQASNPAAGTSVAGTGNTAEQYNAAAGRPTQGGTSSPASATSANGMTPTAGTGNTLDQNQAVSAGSPVPGTAPVETKTKTDNTHSVISGHSTDVKAKKRNPKKKNTEQRSQP
ncbi:hypothetical protein [Spirosoma sp. KUDC1026]|uniref:hypothetical protein n=1 Tax=Spirosoma sp. KUDC1026 TaxID=2745947 RepID=UPI00159BBFB4|nr:hypothetical protein [Spirosoma sp. KUDC1026]QKZ12886.1 hypothetical protein HU175_09675 [Spirosoma sp. KUDC1026]